MKQVGRALALALLLATPALAQDPFESTVAQGDVLAKVRDLAPREALSRARLRTYLEAARYVGLGASIQVDDGRGQPWSRLGSNQVPTGTRIALSAKFTRPDGGTGDPVLTTLSVVPSQPIHTPDFVFHQLEMDAQGNLRAKVHASGRSIDLDIHKIHHDRAGNLVFETHASNHGSLVNMFVPDFRITPDGRLQTRRKNALLPFNRKWKQEQDEQGRPVSFGGTLPIKSWPPRLSDLIALLPEEDAPRPDRQPFALPSLPIRDLGLRTRIETDPLLLGQDADGWLALRDGELTADLHGTVRDGVLTTDPQRPNGVRLRGTVDGVIEREDVKAKLLALKVELDATANGQVPLSDPLASGGELQVGLKLDGDASDIHTRDAEGGTTDLQRLQVSARGKARLIVDPKRRGVRGVLEDTEVTGSLTRLELSEPGQSVKVEGARFAGTLDGALGPGGIERARAAGGLTTTGKTTIDMPLAEGADANVELGPGTTLMADTGAMRPDGRGNLVSGREARVTAHLALEGGEAGYQSLVKAGFVGKGTIDLTAALGFRIDPKQLMTEDGELVVGKVPLNLRLTIGLAPRSKLVFGMGGGEAQEIAFAGKTAIVIDARGEVDPATGTPSLTGADGARVRFLGLPDDTGKLTDLARTASMLDTMTGGKVLSGAKLEFTREGLIVRAPDGREAKLQPSGAGR